MGQIEAEPEITTVGTKGQVVIPRRLRKELDITSKTKLAIYRKDDKIVMKKIEIPPITEELQNLFNQIDLQTKGKKTSEKEILKEIQSYRMEKHTKTGA
jgi:AbrB family looped-hinge helix DNA binding protein